MSRGKNLGLTGKFHSYSCKDKKSCSLSDCKTEISYALKESFRRRKERDKLLFYNPTSSMIYRINKRDI